MLVAVVTVLERAKVAPLHERLHTIQLPKRAMQQIFDKEEELGAILDDFQTCVHARVAHLPLRRRGIILPIPVLRPRCDGERLAWGRCPNHIGGRVMGKVLAIVPGRDVGQESHVDGRGGPAVLFYKTYCDALPATAQLHVVACFLFCCLVVVKNVLPGLILY